MNIIYFLLMFYIKKQENGFTLIEIIIAMIVVGVLMAVAVPNFLGLYNQHQGKDALRQLASAVKEAQRQAMRRGKTCKIKLDRVVINGKTRDRVTVVTSSDPGESGKDYTGCLTNDRILSEFIDLETNLPGTTNKITFSQKGNTPTSGTIKLSIPGANLDKCLVISNGLGIIRTGNYQDGNSGSMARKCKKINY